MNDEQLLRYSRQIMLPEMDVGGQLKLQAATVLIIGMGGLGSPVGMYLAAAGVGHLILVDDDRVDLSNLQRQIAHGQADIGQFKVSSGAATLKAINPDVQVTEIVGRADEEMLDDLVPGAALVIDACDNFSTRFLINRACVDHGVPLVSGAAIRMEGQVAVFDPRSPESPCYQCLYAEGDDEMASCSRNGVMAPLVGIVGSVQAMEAIKVLTGIGTTLQGRLLLLDARHMQWRELRLPPDPQCSACSADARARRASQSATGGTA